MTAADPLLSDSNRKQPSGWSAEMAFLSVGPLEFRLPCGTTGGSDEVLIAAFGGAYWLLATILLVPLAA